MQGRGRLPGSSSSGPNRAQVVKTLDLLVRSKDFVVDCADLVLQARRRFVIGGADFADCLIERIAQARAAGRR